MTLPQRILRELTERLAEFEPPAYGKVNIEISMSYRDAQLGEYSSNVNPLVPIFSTTSQAAAMSVE